MSNSDNTAKHLTEMDVQEAQAALAEALEAEIEQPTEDDNVTDQDPVTEGEVVRLEQDDEDGEALKDLFGGEENPFAAAAEFARQVRMAEALLFAAAEPLDEATLKERLPEDSKIKDILESLQQQYENRGVHLKKTGRKWQFVTSPEVAHILEREQVQPRRLSKAALETLAIIAYHQPCTRAEIEEIRSVAVSKGSLDQLLELGWIRLRGRKEDTPGRPLLYGTSQEFLEHFGLEQISHLPGMADLKAAGLLEARLPPGFTVPTPKDGLDAEGDDAGNEDAAFVQDFHEGDDPDNPEKLVTADFDMDMEEEAEDTGEEE